MTAIARAGVMTEAEWLACKDLNLRACFLDGRASERKARLFTIACCRRVPRLMRDEMCRRAVDAAERFADGAASRTKLKAVEKAFLEELMKANGWSADRAMVVLAANCARLDFGFHNAGGIAGIARGYATTSRREENRIQVS